MTNAINFSWKRILFLFVGIVIGAAFIAVTEYLKVPIDWRTITSAFFVAATVFYLTVKVYIFWKLRSVKRRSSDA